MSQQLVHTVCMDTRDAVQSAEGEFTLELGGDNPRFQAVKVALGSLEFPMTQWTIEEEWSRLYFSEGYRLNADGRTFAFDEWTDDSPVRRHALRLPPHLLEVELRVVDGATLELVAETPHALWIDARTSLLPAIDWAEVELLCGPMGRVSLSHLHATGQLHYVSATRLRLPRLGDGGRAVVHVPTFPSPAALCGVLSHLLQHTTTLAPYELVYYARENRAALQALAYPSGAETLHLRLHGSPLATLLGYAAHERTFRRARNDDYMAPRDEAPPLVLRADPFQGWSFVALEPGWYTPSQRAMCTGQPLRFAQEAELALNRLNFPVPDRIPQGLATAHFLMFADPSGATHSCAVLAGRYSADALAQVLEAGMTRAASLPGTVFTVEYDAAQRRFVFLCEVRTDAGVRPAPFSLLFGHPAQFEPSRLGFDAVALHGRDQYASTRAVDVPRETPANVYKVSEIGHQKRFRVQSLPVSSLTALIVGYEREVVRVRTYAGQLPYVHGLRAGDVVELGPTASSTLLAFEDGEWVAAEHKAAPLAASWGQSGLVVAAGEVASCSSPVPGAEGVELFLRVRRTDALVDCMHMLLSVQVGVRPFNLCFGLPQSISPVALGFPRGATQWGLDGTVRTGGLALPPFEAPAVHSLDHPDYVLLYLAEGQKKGTSLQHRFGRHTTTPFAKLVLYPMVREERMLPRDTALLSGESFSRFTLAFKNPDGTPYHFHNAHFSFSLNFVRVPD